MKKFYFLLVMVLGLMNARAQMLIPNASAQQQDFDVMGSSATAALPLGFVVSANTTYVGGGASTATTLAYGSTGTGAVTGTSGGGVINWANGITASSTDRALGFLTSGSFSSPRNIMLELQNTSGSTITSLTITFDYEKYRAGTRPWDMSFFSGTDGTTWTAQASGNQTYAADGANAPVNPPTTISKSVTISGLNIINNGKYYLRWFYAGSGGSTNSQGLGLDNLSITATLAGSTTGLSTVVAGGTPGPATLSSLVNSSGSGVTNFSFQVNEDGDTDDSDPTLISQIIIGQGSNNNAALSNWTQAIAGAELSDGTNTVTGTINAGNITFASLPHASSSDIGYIADNGNKTYTLKIWLRAALGGTLPVTIDNKQLEFLIQTSGITTEAAGSSAIAISQSVSSGAGTNVINVVATQLAYLQQTTSPTGLNVAMFPAVVISSNDANNNRDLDFTESVRITSTGTLSGTPVDISAVAGLATFSSLTHTAIGTGFTLNAERTSTLDWDITSNPFDIAIASSATDYFRSAVATGDWNDFASWESSSDNTTWIPATLIPNENANTITIQTGHTITVSTAVTADQVIVQNGAILTNTANIFTVANGSGDDVIVENGGILVAASSSTSPAFGTGATANINTGGMLRVSKTGYTGNGSGANANNYIYQNASILEYTHNNQFSASGVTYFPNADAATIPIFRVTSVLGGAVGGSGTTVINGRFEPQANISFTGTGTKTFRNGISGNGNVDGAASGKFIINGATAVLGGSGTLQVSTSGGMDISTTVDLTASKTITGNIALLSNGYIQLGSNSLTVNGAITGGSATGYIITNGSGALTLMNITTATTFPVGNGASYTPVYITNTGTADDFTVHVAAGTPCNVDPNQSVNRVWTITEATPGGSVADITMQWNAADENFTFIRSLCTAVHCAGGVVDLKGANSAASGTDPYTQTITGVTSFSPFGVTSDNAVLPIGIQYLKGFRQGNKHSLTWKVNCVSSSRATMTLERCGDSRSFVPVYSITADAVRCLDEFNYTDMNPLPGMNYYRIRSMDADGKISYSAIVALLNKEKGFELVNIAPNPVVNGNLKLNVTATEKTKMEVVITDMTGKVVSRSAVTLAGGFNTVNVGVGNLSGGVYQVYGNTSEGKTKPLAFVKQ